MISIVTIVYKYYFGWALQNNYSNYSMSQNPILIIGVFKLCFRLWGYLGCLARRISEFEIPSADYYQCLGQGRCQRL